MKKSTPKHIIIKLLKTNDEKSLRADRENRNIICRGIKIRMTYFSLEIQARRERRDIFKIQKFKNCQPRIL